MILTGPIKYPCVHLAIDWQRTYLWDIGKDFLTHGNGASSDQPLALARQAGEFARLLERRGIPTIWAVMVTRDNPVSLKSARKVSKYDLIKYGLAVTPQPTDRVCSKHFLSPFSNPQLHPLLQIWKTQKIIATGLETGRCFATGVADALTLGYNVEAPIDLTTDHDLAGVEPEKFDDANISLLWNYLISLDTNKTNLRITTSSHIIGSKEKPAPPARATPVSELLTATA